MTEKTTSEQLFEQYLNGLGLTDWTFEKEYPGKSRRPDYTVTIEREYLFELKEFEVTEQQSSVICYNPYDDIRRKIEEGRRKFKEFKEWPCGLVLYGDRDLTIPQVMFGAMLGDAGVTLPFDPETASADRASVQPAFLDGGKMVNSNTPRPQNTTISAVITLRHIQSRLERQLGVVVWENPFARIPLPKNILCGPYDERWSVDDGHLYRVYTGEGLLT